MSNRRSSSYNKYSKKYRTIKSGAPVDLKQQFLRSNRTALALAGGDKDITYGVETAAKTGKRVRELIREFPDFYYAPGKKKFIVEDAHYDMIAFDMARMPIRTNATVDTSNDPWSQIISGSAMKGAQLWYVLYGLFTALMASSPGTGYSNAAKSGDPGANLVNPIMFNMNERQQAIVNRAYPRYFDLAARTTDSEWWKQVTALMPIEFPDRKRKVHVTKLKNLQGALRDDIAQVMIFTNMPSYDEVGGFNLFTMTSTLSARSYRSSLEGVQQAMVPIPGTLVAGKFKELTYLERGAKLSTLPVGVSRGQLFDEDDEAGMLKFTQQQTALDNSATGMTSTFDDCLYYTEASYNTILGVEEGKAAAEQLSIVVKVTGSDRTNLFCCRRYPLSSLLDSATGLLDSYNWYESNGFSLTSDKLTIRLGPVKIPAKVCRDVYVDSVPKSTQMAYNMAAQYLPTMFFVDYDEALIAKHKGRTTSEFDVLYNTPGVDRTIAYLKDHFILLNPELYVLTGDEILQAAKICIEVMDHLQGKEQRRTIDGGIMTKEQQLLLVKDYIEATYATGNALVDFNKTTRSVKNAQYVKDIYCCFVPSGRVLNSKQHPTIKVQSNPVFMRNGKQNFLKMFNRTSAVFYPSKPFMHTGTTYDPQQVLSAYILKGVSALNSRVERSGTGQQAIPGQFADELVQGLWGLNAHQRPAVVTLSDTVLAKMYTKVVYPETATVLHTHPMGAAAIRWSQFEVAFGKFVASADCIERAISTSLELFPKDAQNDAPSYVSADVLNRMVGFYNTHIVDQKGAATMGTFFNVAGTPSILALERFRSILVKTNGTQSANFTNQAVLRLLDTPTHSLNVAVNQCSYPKRNVGDTLSQTRIYFSLAMTLLRKFFKTLKVVQRYNGSSLMTVEGLMQATYALPYKEKHQFLTQAVDGTLVEVGVTAMAQLGGVLNQPDSNNMLWKQQMMNITPFGDPVRTRIVACSAALKQINDDPWVASSNAAAVYKRQGASAIPESQKHASVANTVLLAGLKNDRLEESTRQTIADQIGFLYHTTNGAALAGKFMTKHLTEVRNMIGMLMVIYCTSTHKGISDFDLHRLIRQMYTYEQSTVAFFKTIVPAGDQEGMHVLAHWKIDVPPPRKFEKYKRQQADDVAMASATALVARPLKEVEETRNKYISKAGYQAPVYNLIQARIARDEPMEL